MGLMLPLFMLEGLFAPLDALATILYIPFAPIISVLKAWFGA